MEGITINISNHPVLDVERKVEVRGFQMLWSESTIKVFTMCKHYKDGNHINTQSLGDFERILTATNERKVNKQSGIEVRENDGLWKQITDQTIVDESNVIGQFHFFDQLVKNSIVNIPGILSNVITVEDQVYKSYDK